MWGAYILWRECAICVWDSTMCGDSQPCEMAVYLVTGGLAYICGDYPVFVSLSIYLVQCGMKATLCSGDEGYAGAVEAYFI